MPVVLRYWSSSDALESEVLELGGEDLECDRRWHARKTLSIDREAFNVDDWVGALKLIGRVVLPLPYWPIYEPHCGHVLELDPHDGLDGREVDPGALHDESVLVVAVDVVHSPAPIWSGPTSQDDVRAAFEASIFVIRGRWSRTEPQPPPDGTPPRAARSEARTRGAARRAARCSYGVDRFASCRRWSRLLLTQHRQPAY